MFEEDWTFDGHLEHPSACPRSDPQYLPIYLTLSRFVTSKNPWYNHKTRNQVTNCSILTNSDGVVLRIPLMNLLKFGSVRRLEVCPCLLLLSVGDLPLKGLSLSMRGMQLRLHRCANSRLSRCRRHFILLSQQGKIREVLDPLRHCKRNFSASEPRCFRHRTSVSQKSGICLPFESLALAGGFSTKRRQRPRGSASAGMVL